MSDYWNKKMDELNKNSSSSSSSSSNYWKKKLEELEEEEKKKKAQDIAPVKTTTTRQHSGSGGKISDNNRTWFQKSKYFDDGYDFGDVTKTIIGSVADVAENIGTGILGMGEKVTDALAMAGTAMGNAQMSQSLQDELAFNALTNIGKDKKTKDKEAEAIVSKYDTAKKQAVKGTSEFVAKDLYNEEEIAKRIISAPVKSLTGIDSEKASVFGEKSDSLIQSGGQLLATAGLNAVGVPWFLTTGLTSFGAEAENALNQGATFEEATMSAAISAGAEILTEKLSGGIKFGGKTLDDALIKPFTEKISNKVTRSLVNLGIDALGEGTEEVISGIFSNLGTALYKEERIGELLFSEEATDEYLESFIGGAVLGGVSSGIGAVANRNKIELNENEQKVFDKVVEDRIAEEKEKGTDSKKKEAEIRKSVLNDMLKGYIDTDTIESVLGGEEYENYKRIGDARNKYETETNNLSKKLQEKYNELQKEYDSLDETNLEDATRRAEIKEQMADIQERYRKNKTDLEEFKKDTRMDDLKTKLGQNVSELVKDSRLSESYNEIARRGKTFEADLSKYDAKQQETVKKAIESGILNNTNRTHEFVDMVAKLSADKGVLFDFTNNKKIKETGFAIEGKTVNGYKTDDGSIAINIQSSKALETVVGHEITHVLEGTELYTELQNAIKEYATTKGEYESRMQSLRKLYEGVYEGKDFDDKIRAELTSDIVGEYLFTDTDFVNRLSTEKPNVFKKIYDEIKYLCKIATAGSKEARELERVKRNFEKAYRESANVEGGAKYSIRKTSGIDYNNQLGMIENGALNGSNSLYIGLPSAQLQNVGFSASPLAMNQSDYRKSRRTSAKNKNYSSHSVPYDFFEKMPQYLADAPLLIDNGVKVSVITSYEMPDTTGNNSYVIAGVLKDHSMESDTVNLVKSVYPLDDIVNRITKAAEAGRLVYTNKNKAEQMLSTIGIQPAEVSRILNLSKDILPQNSEKSSGNRKYSLSSDTEGKKLTEKQSEYFKDSKMRDDNGNLKVMYHGSQNAGFHIFNSDMSDDNTSLFFVDRNDVAASYSGTSETYEAKTIRTAEDMNNFLAEIGYDEDYSVVEKNGKFELIYDGERVAGSDTAQGIYEEFCWYEGVGEGDANYKVYLNLKNPLVVDAKGNNWNNVSREFSQEIADRYASLTTEEKDALSNLAEWGEYSIFRDEMLEARANAEQGVSGVFDDAYTKSLARAYEKLGGANANLYDAFSIAQDSFSEEAINQFAMKQMKTRDYAQKAKEQGYDGVIFKNIVDNGGYSNGSEGASTVAIAFESSQIKSVANTNPTKDADIRYSLSEDSEGRKLSKEQQEYFKKVSPLLKDENGNIKRYYHGTARGDRVGTYFNPERATSGPMAFFTDNPEIAENYSKSKADTSMSYDPDYDSYETQFRVNINGNDMPLINAWRYLPMSARARIKERAEHTHYDWDDYETLIYDEDTTEAGGGFSWQLREARGNVLQALNEQWLNSGNLFNEEGKYIDVLKFVGVHDELKKLGYGEPYYKDPYYREEKVFEVYLNVTNPFHTADVDEEFLNDARDYVENTDLSIYESETADSDLWDKRSLDPYEWLDRLESDIENETTHAWTSIPDVITDFLKDYGGYDGIVDAGGKHTGYGHQVVIPFYSEQIKNIDNETPTTDVHIDLSLSEEGETPSKYGRFFGKDLMYRGGDIAPVTEKNTATVSKTEKVGTVNEDDYAPMTEAEALRNAEADREALNSLTDADMPPEIDAPIYSADTTSIKEKSLKDISAMGRDILFLTPKERRSLEDVVQKYSTSESQNEADLFNEIKKLFGEKTFTERIEEVAEIQRVLRGYKINVSPYIKRDIADYTQFMRRNFGKITFSKEGLPVDTAYMELSEAHPDFFPEDIVNPSDQLQQMAEVANMVKDETQTYELDDDVIQEATDVITEAVNSYKEKQLLKTTERESRAILRDELKKGKEAERAEEKAKREAEQEAKPTRAKLHNSIIENIKNKFADKGFDFDEVLNSAKNLSTISTVDNTPQRVMEKALGYKQGQTLADETVNKVAQNESEGIKWLNSFTDRKNGVLAQISKQYGIKPGSKKSAAAQMYAEGFYVNKNNEIVEYGDRELAIDFPNVKVQESIKGLANDPRIRQIYDETLAAINESRSRNLYPEIPRLDNYFLHFRAMEDTFSRLGLPFNPNDIRAKDLPTDLNGVTADLKPGQPYFASAMHREGMRTSFDLLGGLEKYLTSAKNQIYHIDDIQTLRALRNYIADTYGQAKGLESLDELTDEEAQYRIEQVYSSHLSTFAKFLNEEANILAGKTTLIDRGVEGVVGRRAFTVLDTINKQVGSNMVGWNVSSSLTNFLPVAQTFAKTNKFDFTKAFAQTVSSKIGSIFGKTDSFVENNPTIIRRKGAERFHRNFWQKAGDTGYLLMSAVDDISTELIVRTKYNELIRKGMDEQKASFEADKWVSRLMGDRSLGQQPQLYNSKALGLFTKFQLEVRNQLDSQFYDTIQETKVSNEEIENKLLRNAKTAAKVTSVFVQLAAVQHLYGMAFESIAGYNPAFDIIDVLIKTLGFDDDEEDEDTPLDNIGEGFLALIGDLPYTSIVTGGRIPFSSALPSWESIKQIATGEDEYGNKKSRVETFAGMLNDTVPYYVLPTGFGQIKKTAQGLGMFSDEHPVKGSYTDSGNLRFPVEDNLKNRIQAGVFGQYASENARYYFDNEISPLKEKQIQEYADVEMPIKDYWQYREDLKGLDSLEEKFDFIAGMDLPVEKKNILINNIVDRKEKVDLENYDDFENYEEFDFYAKNTEKYNFLQDNGISYKEYKSSEDAKENYDSIYSWWKNNPEDVTFSKAITDNVIEYKKYTSDLYDIRADKDENGDSISGTAKEKKIAYINNLDLDYGQRIILLRSLYDSKKDKEAYNADIVDYLNSRDDISYEEMVTILKELDFEVDSDGNVSW